jgi:hypothetical protein
MKNIAKQNCGCSNVKPYINRIHYDHEIQLKNQHIPRDREELPSNMQMIISEGYQPGLPPTLRSNKNIIVNPWSAVQKDKMGNSLLPSINISSSPVINSTVDTESDGSKTQHKEVNKPNTEPIYNEIKAEHLKVSNSEDSLSNTKIFNQENNYKESKGNKSEIIYWQITAKEVAKFKPCTEKFIDRD